MRAALLLLLFHFVFHGYAQYKGQDYSTEHAIFRLTNEQSRAILVERNDINDSFFDDYIVNYNPKDSTFNKQDLPLGNYLDVYVAKNQIIADYFSVQNVTPFIINNSTDLIIELIDKKGNKLPTNEVQLNSKSIPYDHNIQAYKLKNSNKHGLLTIRHEGIDNYYMLDRKYDRSNFKRVANKMLYRSPLKHIGKPIRFVVNIPIDGYKSIKNKRPQGSIRKITKPVSDVVHSFEYYEPYGWVSKVLCFFDKHADHCPEIDYTGYLSFSQPMYRPEDSVLFKAFVVKGKNGKPVNRPLDLYISKNYRTGRKKIATIDPYRPGGYSFLFDLHDSLNLQLDSYYRVSLEDEYDVIIDDRFRLEDYDLSHNAFDVILDKSEITIGDTLKITLSAEDQNELPLYDIKYELELHTINITGQEQDSVFTPSILYTKSDVFSDTTHIRLPATVFSPARIKAKVIVKFKDAANEYQTITKSVLYKHSITGIYHEFADGQILFDWQENGNSVPTKAIITDRDRFGYALNRLDVDLPYEHKINALAASYIVQANNFTKEVYSDASSGLLFNGSRTADSISISSTNPNKIPFQYFIYKANSLLKEGISTKLDTTFSAKHNKNILLITNHVWQGNTSRNTYNIYQNKHRVNVSLDAPSVVYPGQDVEMTVLVTDSKELPVSDMDITAQAYTASFKTSAPGMPYFSNYQKKKEIINEFSIEPTEKITHRSDLSYQQWKELFGLDSLAYYTFRNPTKAITRHFIPSKDSITQFAPIAVLDGNILQTVAIELDKVPIYFGFVRQPKAYSFKIDKKPHHLRLRLPGHEIMLDSITFQPYGKTLLVLDISKLDSTLVNDRKTELSQQEIGRFKPYLFNYRAPSRKYGVVYLDQDSDIHVLSGNSYGNVSSGPIKPHNFKIVSDSLNYDLTHEPNYQYEFLKEVVKMREMPITLPKYIGSSSIEIPLNQWVITKDSINRLKAKKWSTIQKMIKFRTLNRLKDGKASLVLNKQWEAKDKDILYSLIILRETDSNYVFLRGGFVKKLNNISPGKYEFYYLTDSLVLQPDRILKVRANGENYYKIETLLPSSDDVATKIRQLISKLTADRELTYREQEIIETAVQTGVDTQLLYDGPTTPISGSILDEDGEPIIGATIRVKDTGIGAISGLDGSYTIQVPLEYLNKEFVISFIGTSPQTIPISNHSTTQLKADQLFLDEVVVTALGTTVERQNLSYSVANVSSNITTALQGHVAGLEIIGDPGVSQQITLRGATSLNTGSLPLVIIDGVIYNGFPQDLTAKEFKSVDLLKGISATALYGARAANGAILITTLNGIEALQLPGKFEKLPEIPRQPQPKLRASLRDNFSDTGFWQPTLSTDKDGKATFTVTFPDDITKWDAHILAMNGKKQSGQFSTSIKSYKPVLAELHAPRFLTQGDKINVAGELNNYTTDTIKGRISFSLNEKEMLLDKKVTLTEHNDYDVPLNPTAYDSLTMLLKLEVPELEYYDGEKRKIKVNRRGIEEHSGWFYNLYSDTTLTLNEFPENTSLKIQAQSNLKLILDQEVEYLKNYKHLCNEQLASKLHAYLYDRELSLAQNKVYEHDKEINKLIAKLAKGKNNENTWGWWPGNDLTPWINLHVVGALAKAKENGFNTPDLESTQDAMIFQLERFSNDSRSTMLILETLQKLNAPIAYNKYIDNLQIDTSHYELRMKRECLRKQLGLKYDSNYAHQFAERDMLGNYKLKIPKTARYWYYPGSRNFELNLYGYHLVESKIHKRGILNNLLSERKGNHFLNTYQASLMLDILKGSGDHDVLNNKATVLEFSGDLTDTVSVFPYETTIGNATNLNMSKKGKDDVYVTVSYKNWLDEPAVVDSLFSVTSRFYNDEGESISELQKGEKTYLKVEVEALYDAKYVMINVPIPSSCQYLTKRKGFGESYREHFKDETQIFIENFPKGKHVFSVELIPRFTGSFIINPAKVELMYAPVKFGRNALTKVTVK